MRDKRPVNLDIATIHLPVTAVVSILHRISGVFLFFGSLWLLWLLAQSLDSAAGFAQAREHLQGLAGRIGLWLVLCALLYHGLAGVRHLLMDLGFGESLQGGRAGAWAVLVLSVSGALLAGWWLW